MTVDRIVPTLVALFSVVSLALWLRAEDPPLTERLPPARPATGRLAAPRLPIRETHRVETSDVAPPDLPGSWPRFRGAKLDGASSGEPPLARTWGPNGPPRLWSVELGEGYAGAAVLAGRVYVMDYDEAASRDALRCLSLENGREIWRLSYPIDIKWNYGMSRTVPAATDKWVVSFGPLCHVVCADAKTGALKWGLDLVTEFKAEVPPWYAGQCPLIDRGRAIIGAGAPDALLIAVDCGTGEVAWRTPNPRGWKMSHSSVMPLDLGGRRLYLYCASRGIVAVDAADGRIVWEDGTWWASPATIPSPVVLGDGRVFLTAGYGSGSRMLRFEEAGGRVTVTKLFDLPEHVFGAEQHTPVLTGGHLYGVDTRGRLACLDLTGRRLWSGGRRKQFGRGSYIAANGLLFLMDDVGVLRLAEATPAGYRQLAEAKVLPAERKESWAPMAIAAGRLLVRDMNRMVCLDVRRK